MLLLLFPARPRNCDPVVVVVTTANVSSVAGGEGAGFGGCGLVGVSSGLLLPDEVGWLGEPELLALTSCMLCTFDRDLYTIMHTDRVMQGCSHAPSPSLWW